MSEILRRILALVLAGDVHVSDHGYEELAKDDILLEDVMAGIATAILLEEYPDRFRGPGVLTLQHDARGQPLHVVWALPANERRPTVLVTAYRPDPTLWDADFRQRKDQ
jgi:hypothetical protein